MSLSRRQFLHASLAAAAGFHAAPRRSWALATPRLAFEEPQPLKPFPHEYDAIVIGAGIAGLAAAQRLIARGVNAIVLEARDRVGGRLWTSRLWPDCPVDLGADRIRGSNGNPILALAQSLGLETVVLGRASLSRYQPDGRPMTDHEALAIEQRLADCIRSCNIDRAEIRRTRSPDVPLSRPIGGFARLQQLTARQHRELDHAISTEITRPRTADADSISLLNYDVGDRFLGPDTFLPDGHSRVIETLAEGLPVHTGHIVHGVARDSGGITVQTSRGPFRARKVLVTLPLGVLKGGDVTFAPTLPAAKARAIAFLGAGAATTVAFRFATTFWDPTQRIHSFGPERAHWVEWLNLHALAGRPVLCSTATGSFARALDGLTDDEIAARALDALRAIRGFDTPEPHGVQIARWNADPFTRGGAASFAPGSSPDDVDALAEPIADRIHFAGDATERDFLGTTHGAYMSGIREADRMVG